MNKLKRYLLFLVGLFVNALGVSLVTKANLGTSPISSIPYVLSLNFPFTLGNFTIFFSIFLIFKIYLYHIFIILHLLWTLGNLKLLAKANPLVAVPIRINLLHLFPEYRQPFS
mgnify:CR=1 FL=1